MSAEIWAAVISGVIVVMGQIGTSLYIAGKLTGKLDALDGRMSKNETTDTEQWHEINSHAQRISYTEAKINGRAQ